MTPEKAMELGFVYQADTGLARIYLTDLNEPDLIAVNDFNEILLSISVLWGHLRGLDGLDMCNIKRLDGQPLEAEYVDADEYVYEGDYGFARVYTVNRHLLASDDKVRGVNWWNSLLLVGVKLWYGSFKGLVIPLTNVKRINGAPLDE